jgi:hypothetical protein
MRNGPEEAPQRDEITTEQVAPRRLLRILAVGIVAPIVFCLGVLFLFPHRIDPVRLGELAWAFILLFVVLPAVVSRYWHARRRFMASCCVLLAVLLVAVSVGTPKPPVGNLCSFQTAAEQNFVLEGTGDNAMLRHPGLGLSVQPPGTDFTTVPVSRVNERSFRWGFINNAAHKALMISAQECRLVTPLDAQNALQVALKSFRNSLAAKGSAVKLTSLSEGVVWQPGEHYAEAVGTFGTGFFCVRVFPVDCKDHTLHPVLSVYAITLDRATACNMARSLVPTRSIKIHAEKGI